jgi:hypothetical protein
MSHPPRQVLVPILSCNPRLMPSAAPLNSPLPIAPHEVQYAPLALSFPEGRAARAAKSLFDESEPAAKAVESARFRLDSR